MSGKNLTFKLIMDGDSKGLVAAAKQSETVTKKVFETIKTEAKKVQIDGLISELNQAAKEISELGDKSAVSANQIREMSMKSQQMVGALKSELVGAQAELVRLSQTNAAPTELANAANLVAELKASILSVEASFGAFESTAKDAMSGVDKATTKTIAEVQKFTSVDLTGFISETQNASRAIESMGDGAIVSAKEVDRISTIGVAAIESLERELLSARNAWKALVDAGDSISLDELNAAKERVTNLERALELTEGSMSGFKAATQQAIPIVDNLENSLDGTNTQLHETSRASETVAHNVEGLRTGFTALTGALAALGIGVTAQEMAQTVDSYKNLIATLKIAVGEYGNLEQALDDVTAVAIRTNSNLEATAKLYSKLLKAGKEYKITQKDALKLTETINMAIQVSGTSAEAAEAALYQLNQAIGSGVLRGEEYASVLEQAPRIIEAIADGLGVTIGKLKEYADNGKLSTDVVTKALLNQSQAITSEFSKFPLTIGKSTENLKTAWMVYLGELDRTHGVSERVANAIKYIAENLDQLVSTLTFAAQAFIAYKALGMASVFLEKANGARIASLAIQQETASLVANTQVQLANASAAKATAGAHAQIGSSISSVLPTFTKIGTGLMGVVSRFGAYGLAAGTVVAAGGMVKNMLVDTGEAIGENLAKFTSWVGAKWNKTKTLSEVEKELAASEELLKKKQEEAAAAKEKNIARTEMLKNASLGLNEVSKATVEEFDKLVKEGGKVADVLGQIAKAFNFDTTTGINNGLTALLALQTQGKATGEEIRKALAGALTDEDLVKFQGRLSAIPVNIEKQLEATNAKVKAKQLELDAWKKANSDMNQKEWETAVDKQRTEINKLQAEASALHVQYANSVKSTAMVQGAVLDEAIRRTGLSYEELQGKSTKAFEKASGDVNIVVNSMDELKNKGVDVGRALDASISNAIKTATTQQELDALKVKIEGLRSDLGAKVADGLLQQASQQLLDLKDKADQARAGINSTAEAFGVFGMQTPAQLKVVAEQYKQAFNEMKNSGQATLHQQQEAFKQYAEKAIAANKGIADSALITQAYMLDLDIQMDATGKATVSKLGEIQRAAVATQRSVSQISQPAAQNQPEVSAEKKASDDYWDNFKAEMKAKTDAANTRAQAQRSGGRSSNAGSGLTDSNESAYQAPAMPDAPMVASSFDITPLQDIQPTEKKILELQSGGKVAELQGTPEAVNSVEEMLQEFEMLKRSM